MRISRLATLAATFLFIPASQGAAQGRDDWDVGRVQMTRQALLDLMSRLEQSARSEGYSQALRARSRYEVALIRARLADGDFQVGDRILLTVEGEQQLSDTFGVEPRCVLNLPIIGEVPLGGVLRSELEPHLARHLGRYLNSPVVRARSLIRVSILGEVNRPGFYTAPTDIPLTDALMLGGGPTRDAKLTAVRVERGTERVWEGQALQHAIAEGRTLDQLNLRAGDRMFVPRQGRRDAEQVVRILGILVTLPAAIYGLTRVF